MISSPDMHHFGRMRHAAVGHIGDVQQSVDAAQIHERAVFRQILDDAGDHRAFVQMLQRDGFRVPPSSCSTAILRETTTLPRRRFSLMILTGMS